MTALLLIIGFLAAVALWCWRVACMAADQAVRALALAEYWQAVAARQMAQAIAWRHRAERYERERGLLNDLFAPQQHMTHSPATVSQAEIEALVTEPVELDDIQDEGV